MDANERVKIVTGGRPRTYSDEDFRKADKQGRTVKEVAAILGVSANSVRCMRYALRQRGAKVKPRTGGRPPKERT